MKRIVIAALAVGLGCLELGCSSTGSCFESDCGGVTGTAGSGGAGGSGGSAGSGGSGGSGSGSSIRTGTCTEAGSVCVTLKMPTASAAPTRLIAGLYKTAPPPLAPPDKTGDQYDSPVITAGAEVAMKMLNVNVDGDYYFYAALYMPGGGSFIPVKGIDYQAYTTEPTTLSKSGPTTYPKTLEFTLAQ